MIPFSLLESANDVYLYPKPIRMNLGEEKIIEICLNEMGLEPCDGNLFLFFNRAMNKLKLIYFDESGCQSVLRGIFKGGFVSPVALSNERYIKLPKESLSRLFKMPKFGLEDMIATLNYSLGCFDIEKPSLKLVDPPDTNT